MKNKSDELKIPFQFKGNFEKCFYNMGVECVETLFEIHSTPCPMFLKKDDYLDRRYWALLLVNNIFDAWYDLAIIRAKENKSKIKKIKEMQIIWENYKNNFFKINAYKEMKNIIKKVKAFLKKGE